jgi:thiol reductant ABC exporter CydC subunit
VTFRLLTRLRVWFYTALEPLAPARLIQHRSGDLLSRLVVDIESLEQFYTRVIAPPVVAGLVMGVTWLLLAAFDLHLAGVNLLFLLLAGLGVPLLTRFLSRNIGEKVVAARSDLNVVLVDTIQGAADLLVAGQSRQQRQQLHRLSQTLAGWQERAAWVTGLQAALSGLLVSGATLAILLIAIPLVNQDQLDGVYLTVLVLASMASFEGVLPLPEAVLYLEHSLAAARRLFEIVDAEPAVPEPPPGVTSPLPQTFDLVVKNLHFQYSAADLPALHDISFSLAEGKRLAIVGPSGSGKTSLVNVLLRFWEYQAGEIQVGGYDLRRYRPADLRRLMSVVSQQTYLFNGTLRENLLMPRPEASETELYRAAEQAHLDAFIRTLPQGYDTWIGEQGLRLSGGQRQRLAIGRALLKNGPFLILDEATANLDALVERELMEILYGVMTDRTTLIITHRLVGLEEIDEILVLKAGRIVERGRHHDLLQAETLYRRMWRLQQQVGAANNDDICHTQKMTSDTYNQTGISAKII